MSRFSPDSDSRLVTSGVSSSRSPSQLSKDNSESKSGVTSSIYRGGSGNIKAGDGKGYGFVVVEQPNQIIEGREVEVTISTVKQLHSGRGGSGNIRKKKHASLTSTASVVAGHEAPLLQYERDIVSASVTKRQVVVRSGRGGGLAKPKDKRSKDKAVKEKRPTNDKPTSSSTLFVKSLGRSSRRSETAPAHGLLKLDTEELSYNTSTALEPRTPSTPLSFIDIRANTPDTVKYPGVVNIEEGADDEEGSSDEDLPAINSSSSSQTTFPIPTNTPTSPVRISISDTFEDQDTASSTDSTWSYYPNPMWRCELEQQYGQALESTVDMQHATDGIYPRLDQRRLSTCSTCVATTNGSLDGKPTAIPTSFSDNQCAELCPSNISISSARRSVSGVNRSQRDSVNLPGRARSSTISSYAPSIASCLVGSYHTPGYDLSCDHSVDVDRGTIASSIFSIEGSSPSDDGSPEDPGHTHVAETLGVRPFSTSRVYTRPLDGSIGPGAHLACRLSTAATISESILGDEEAVIDPLCPPSALPTPPVSPSTKARRPRLPRLSMPGCDH